MTFSFGLNRFQATLFVLKTHLQDENFLLLLMINYLQMAQTLVKEDSEKTCIIKPLKRPDDTFSHTYVHVLLTMSLIV